MTPLERLRQSGIKPDRGLGQNFLIDPNILDVIERLAGLGPGDVVLEVGPGLGVLTERLLDRCKLVHCVELDRRLASLLEGEFGLCPGFRLHLADAMRFDFHTLTPSPGKFVANLPYNVAAPLIMTSFEELPSVRFWCLMLQKEIADRLFAAPGSSNYGGLSVMTQLAAEKVSSRTVAPTVFYPRPRVQSSLLAFRRRDDAPGPGAFGRIREIVYGCFSHRRKKLVNSLAEAAPGILPQALGAASPAGLKRRLEGLLEEMGISAGARPQELTPEQFERLAGLIDRRSV